jgi:hypothetical protein
MNVNAPSRTVWQSESAGKPDALQTLARVCSSAAFFAKRLECARLALLIIQTSDSSIPKGLRNKAQGCEERATLGNVRGSTATLKGLRRRAMEIG